MGIGLSKKGIMFTILSVLICALIITSFFTFQSVSLDSNVENVKLRINSIDRYVSETDLYIKSITGISGTKTLNFMNSIMMGNNSFLNNYTKQFESCLMTGKLNVPASWPAGPNPVNCPPESQIFNKFEYLENFSRSNLNIDSNITLYGVKLTQDNPWELKVWINYSILINDSYAFWNETRLIYTTISIIGLKDPTYYIMSSGSDIYNARYMMTVNATYARYWFEFPSTAHQVVLNRQYFKWQGAPSYLDRLNNISSPSLCCGIVSIVNITTDSMLFTPTVNRSNLDFEFWKNTNVNYNNYKRYNFWHPSVVPGNIYRLNWGINDTVPGLNGTIVRDTIAEMFNMTNSTYLREYPFS